MSPLARRASVRDGNPQDVIQLAQRSKCRSDLLGEEAWLFPRGKVAAFREPVVVNQLRVSFLRPAPRSLIDLVRKSAHGNRDLDTSRVEKAALIFPVETSRRDCRVRQPVEGDVI